MLNPRKSIKLSYKLKASWQYWGIPLFLSLFSIIEVFSASQFRALELKGNPYYFAIIHTGWIIIAITLSLLTFIAGKKSYKTIARVGYIVSVILLVAIYFTPAYNGAHRWINLGTITTIQPSEISKLLLVLFFAYYLSSKHNFPNITFTKYTNNYLTKFLILLSIPSLLILFEPDLSTTAIIAGVIFSMLLLHDSKFYKQLLILVFIISLVIFGLGIITTKYRSDRLNTYIHLLKTGEVPDKFGKGYQIYNILIGIGSGGLWGKGLGQSRQKEGYLLEMTAFTDSIIAVIFEELGFFLSLLFLALYFYYYFLLTITALRIKDSFEKLVIWGFAHLFLFQTVIHTAANLALIPLTGVVLPFVTYGGTSMIINWIIVAIITRFVIENKTSLLS